MGDLEKKVHQYLSRASVRQVFVRNEIWIGAVTDLELRFRGRRLETSKTLASFGLENGDHVDAEATWTEYGIPSFLYVHCQVNGVDVPGFVDCGCAISTMSTRFARRLGLLDHVDTDFAYEVAGPKGVQVLGSLHEVEVHLGGTRYSVNFDVMESGQDLWIGLDMMFREGMRINVPNGTLDIASTGCQVPLLTLREARRRVLKARRAVAKPTRERSAVKRKATEDEDEGKSKRVLRSRPQ